MKKPIQLNSMKKIWENSKCTNLTIEDLKRTYNIANKQYNIVAIGLMPILIVGIIIFFILEIT